jgi:hypothetical protein
MTFPWTLPFPQKEFIDLIKKNRLIKNLSPNFAGLKH